VLTVRSLHALAATRTNVAMPRTSRVYHANVCGHADGVAPLEERLHHDVVVRVKTPRATSTELAGALPGLRGRATTVHYKV
jgi:hypothetical protein